MRIWFFAALLWCCSACKNKPTVRTLPLSTGELGKINIVLETSVISDDLKRSLHEVFGQIQPLYGQPEPYFELSFLTPGLLKGATRLDGTLLFVGRNVEDSEFRNFFEPFTDSVYTSYTGKSYATFVMKDLWASPQRVFFILAQQKDSLPALIRNNAGIMLKTVLELEQEEAGQRLTLHTEAAIYNELMKKHKLGIQVPLTYHIARNEKEEQGGFIWLRKETKETDQGLVIHYETYKDTLQFSLPYIIARRDSLYRKHMPGPSEGSFMATETQFPFKLLTTEFKGVYAREYYGLWTVVNDFMGGPYFSRTLLDEKNNRVITIEGFVYAPRYEKTKYIRELQGLMSRISF